MDVLLAAFGIFFVGVMLIFGPILPIMVRGWIRSIERRGVWGYLQGQTTQGLRKTRDHVARQRRRSRSSGPGFVYLMKGGDFYKIGLAINVEDRLRSHRTSSPYPPEMIHTIRTPSMRRLETALHHAYAHKRTTGEWFALEADDVAAICNIPQTINERDLELLEA
jgi:hypothetical protein